MNTFPKDLALVLACSIEKHFDCEIIDIASQDNTFHCDFYYNDPLSVKHFDTITQMIRHIVAHDLPISHANGQYVIDRCAVNSTGPHGASCKSIGDYFIITGISGLHSEKPAQRISGIWFDSEESMQNYLKHMEEIKEYDHRHLGAKLGIFMTDPEITPGMISWLPNGAKIIEKMKQYLRRVLSEHEYNEVITPMMANKSLWKNSGHFDLFRQNMFFPSLDGGKSDNSDYALKPMNCPLHVEIFKHMNLTYKQLPYKMAEFGCCHRYEASGALHGLFRVRAFTQDDAHIFCTTEQIEGVITEFCNILKQVYVKFGFNDIEVNLSTRPEQSAGTDEIWAHAEAALGRAATAAGLSYIINEGDGAFYGPKLDFRVKDSRDRVWQCGTVQLDFVIPERLGATYVDQDGQKKTPVMVHRAILGSIERFLGVLLEHTKGKLPFWLQPTQIMVLPINKDCKDYAVSVKKSFEHNGYSAELDGTDETLGYKIRKWWTERKIPVICILGNRERDSGKVSLRINGSEVVESIDISEAISYINNMEEMEAIN